MRMGGHARVILRSSPSQGSRSAEPRQPMTPAPQRPAEKFPREDGVNTHLWIESSNLCEGSRFVRQALQAIPG